MAAEPHLEAEVVIWTPTFILDPETEAPEPPLAIFKGNGSINGLQEWFFEIPVFQLSVAKKRITGVQKITL